MNAINMPPTQANSVNKLINRSKSRSKNKNRNINRTKKNLRARLGLNKECPPGFILRKPHYKKISEAVKQEGFYIKRKGKVVHVKPQKNTIFVKAACVKNTSRQMNREFTEQSYSKRLAKQLKKGELLAFGYNFRLPGELRHIALVKAVNELGALQVYHKLDAVAIVFREKNLEASKIFSEDRDWLESRFQILK